MVSKYIQLRGACVTLASAMLMVLGMTIAAPASAAERSTEADVTVASAEDGLTIQINGAGYRDLPKPEGGPPGGVYVALRDTETTNEDINNDTSKALATENVKDISDGAFSTELNAPASELDPDAEYEVIVWVAHGNITDDTLLATVPVELSQQQHEYLFGADDSDDNDDTADDDTADDDTADDGADNGTDNGGGNANRPQRPANSDGGNNGNSANNQRAQNTSDASKKQDSAGTSSNAGGSTGNTSAVGAKTKCTPANSGSSASSASAKQKSGSPQLTWGVKSSFVSYVEGGIANGKVSVGGGAARSGGAFTWGAGTGDLDDSGTGTLTYPRWVQFTGHDVVLNLRISNLRVEMNGDSGTLVGDMKSQDMDGNDVSATGITIATLSFSSPSADGGKASVSLTGQGAKSFSDFYSAGEEMDPLTVSVSGKTGGGESSNATGGGSTGKAADDCDGDALPNTGASSTDMLGLGLGGGLTFVGAMMLLMAYVRRRMTAADLP